MRLFVAIDLPAAVRDRLGEGLAAARAGRPRARWVPPRNLHLTLEFLGEVPAAKLAPLESALGDALAGAKPARLQIAGAGSFPPGRPARVLWLGVEAGPELADARRRAARAAWGVLDGEGDDRPFRPHLTVGRCRPPWPAAAVEGWTAALAGLRPEPFVAAEATLFESRLGPAGAVYRAAATYPLGTG